MVVNSFDEDKVAGACIRRRADRYPEVAAPTERREQVLVYHGLQSFSTYGNYHLG